MARYDIYSTFEKIPSLLKMDLVRRGDRWYGQYYMNGERHKERKDKLKVVKWKDSIWVMEEGGESMSLIDWLINYGGASDFTEAIRILKGQREPIVYKPKERRVEEGIVLYVNREVMNGLAGYDLKGCALYRWMCTMFPEAKVQEAWRKYGVTTDRWGNAVYWFLDAKGRILHDKRMKYLENGHRDREFGAWRKFKTADGYTGRCFFGEHLLKEGERVYCCESEKTALLFYLYYGKLCIATGGKNNLAGKNKNFMLLPDMDAREEWAKMGECWPWWNKWPDAPDHADIGDYIVMRKTI